jgi:glutathione peroxidase
MKVSDFPIHLLNGSSLDWSAYEGKKLLLVNVASECGLTPQYNQLQELQDTFGGDKFTVIGFPCNDFGAQEPGSAEQIESFCQLNYGVTFPITEKIHTTGENKHSIYNYLTETTQSEVQWNFQKFLVNENGEVVKSLSPQTLPNDAEILSWIEQ